MRDVSDAKRVRAICDLVETIRVGNVVDTWREATGALRDLLDTEQVWMFQFWPSSSTSWCISRWAATGDPDGFAQAFSNTLATSPTEWAWFKPSCPDPAQRNRVVESLSASSKACPGYFEASRVYRDAMYPHRVHRHRQLRVLVCDGDQLMGWFGAVQPDDPTRRQHEILRVLIPSLHRRMRAERCLEASLGRERALEAALELIDSPALLLVRGAIAYCNRAARGLAADSCAELLAACERARVQPDRSIELVPIGDDQTIAIVRKARTFSVAAGRIEQVASYWKLSPRTAEVLKHVMDGHPNATIAQLLGISTRAVELHVSKLLDRADVSGRAALVARVLS
jgi:DNA-binding CsgD family transcriptional regulator